MSDHKGVLSSLRPIAGAPGAHSLAEILSQPQFWSRSLNQLQSSDSMQKLRQNFAAVSEWLFVGCGSSYYIALSAAASWSIITGQKARALPASEILLFPDLVSEVPGKVAAAAISRSGRTSETLGAAEFLERESDIRVLAVTGTEDQALEQIATAALPLLPSDEESTVMTRSFTSMLLGLQYLAALMKDEHSFIKALSDLPTLAGGTLARVNEQVREFVFAREFADYVCLGQGPFYGVACEAALKITEMSASYCQSFHTLEFRHGPKSVVGPETLIMFLLSEQGYESERDVLEEVKRLGGTTLTITNHADARTRASSDLLIELGYDLPELARIAPYVFAGQLIGLYTGLKKGLNPDSPRHLSRVVLLQEEDLSQKAERAPL